MMTSIVHLSSNTVPVKYKLTVSTWNSNLDTRCFRESRFEIRGSSFEFRVSRRSKNFSRKRSKAIYISKFVTIEINNTALHAASFTHARVYVFHINFQIVSLELNCWIAIIQHSLHRKNNTRTNQPNLENAACEREFFISWYFRLFPVPASSNFNLFAVFKLLERSYEWENNFLAKCLI